jgi:hypothetical protein
MLANVLRSSRSFVLAAVVTACGGGATPSPAQAPPKVEPGVDLAKTEIPEHSAASMSETAKPMLVTTKGSLRATLNGHPKHFDTLPVGGNAAIWAPSTRVARVLVGGSEDDSGFPTLRLVLEGVRLDTLELPTTFSLGRAPGTKTHVRPEDAEKPIAEARPRLVYEIAARKIWESDPEGPVVGSITLESFDGKRLTGSFAANVKPRSVAFGPPLTIEDGHFEVDLRLNGVAPGKPATK